MTDTLRENFEAHCKKENPAYKPTDDGVSNRHDWAIWQAATMTERERQSFEATGVRGLLPPPTGTEKDKS